MFLIKLLTNIGIGILLKKPIGKFQIEFDNYGVKFKNAKFNLMRDEKTGNFLVPYAAEKYANLKNGDISGIGLVP